MKKSITLFILLTLPTFANSQDYFRPYIDSLIFETKRGRSCENVKTTLLLELSKGDSVINEQKTSMKHMSEIIGGQKAVIGNFQYEGEVKEAICKEEKRGLKSRLSRWKKIAIGEGALVVILIILL